MKTTFLFGAGAEIKYGLPSGEGFNRHLLKSNFSEERRIILGKHLGNYSLIYPNSQKIFLETIYLHKKEAYLVLDKDEVDKCCEYYENKEGDSLLIKEYCRKYYSILVDNSSDSDEIAEFFFKYAAFFSALDEKFNGLRNEFLTSGAKRVINAYTTIFILMIKQLYDVTDNDFWEYETLFKTLNNPYTKTQWNIDSYYKRLQDYPFDYEIFTTNYTDLAEIITQKEVTYLHGNLKWFEDYEKLIIYDVSKEGERQKAICSKNTLFPFILIPSGVKPIICKKQIEQFHQFVQKLYSSNILIVVGYRFNSDDNHINSIIAEWLRIGNHKMIVMNYEHSTVWEKLKWIDDITVHEIEFGNLKEDLVFDNSHSLLSINVNGINSMECYDFLLNQIKSVSAIE